MGCFNYQHFTIGTSTHPVRILLNDCCPQTTLFETTNVNNGGGGDDFLFYHRMLHRLASTDLFPVGFIFTGLKEDEFNKLSAWYIKHCSTPIHSSTPPPSTFSTDWKGVQRDLKSSSNLTDNKLLNFSLPDDVDNFLINMDIFLKVIFAKSWGTATENQYTVEEDSQQ